MTTDDLFVQPMRVATSDDCAFYHTLTLKNGERFEGSWELDVDTYLGGFDFAGKLALDIGTASGALTWAMEAKGAEVIGFDLSADADWDVIPSIHDDYLATIEARKRSVHYLHRAWWYCHERNESCARAVYGHVYELPVALGPVDVSVFGAILLHLRDPFRALQAATRITGETVIVTEVLPAMAEDALALPVARLMPDLDAKEHIWTWWHLTPELVVQMLKLLGFAESTVSFHSQRYSVGDGVARDKQMFTVSANRTLSYDPARGY